MSRGREETRSTHCQIKLLLITGAGSINNLLTGLSSGAGLFGDQGLTEHRLGFLANISGVGESLTPPWYPFLKVPFPATASMEDPHHNHPFVTGSQQLGRDCLCLVGCGDRAPAGTATPYWASNSLA